MAPSVRYTARVFNIGIYTALRTLNSDNTLCLRAWCLSVRSLSNGLSSPLPLALVCLRHEAKTGHSLHPWLSD
ncbi:hypothetical protein [Aeromonas sp. QDB12]|uniref:hypothetical protein n=1 Tax=Aeromonas sp. QDB12 TaxID=2990483 RepID=UPI003FA43F16